jgi:hypothetical protein
LSPDPASVSRTNVRRSSAVGADTVVGVAVILIRCEIMVSQVTRPSESSTTYAGFKRFPQGLPNTGLSCKHAQKPILQRPGGLVSFNPLLCGRILDAWRSSEVVASLTSQFIKLAGFQVERVGG